MVSAVAVAGEVPSDAYGCMGVNVCMDAARRFLQAAFEGLVCLQESCNRAPAGAV